MPPLDLHGLTVVRATGELFNNYTHKGKHGGDLCTNKTHLRGAGPAVGFVLGLGGDRLGRCGGNQAPANQ